MSRTTFSARFSCITVSFIVVLLAFSSLFLISPGAIQAQTVAGKVRVGGNPFGIAVNTATNQIYVANSNDNNVTIIDADTNETIYVVTGLTPRAVAVNPITNKAYVANLNSGTVTVIDGKTYGTTTIGAGTSPDAVAVNPVTNQIYVANRDSATVTIIDGATNSASAVSVGAYPRALAVNVVTNKIYVANRDSNNVSVIDGASNTVTATIAVGTKPRAIAANPVTNQIYVGNWQSNNVSIIDGASNAVVNTVSAGTSPRSIAVNPVTNKIYVANIDSNNVTVIDGATQGTTTIVAGKAPRSVAVDSSTNTIYVANRDSNSVTVINGTTNTAFALNSPGAPRAIAVNPVTHKVYVGNRNNMKVTVINGLANGATAVSAGQNPSAVAANPATGKIYVANSSDSTVTVIDTVANTTATVPVGTTPVAVAVNPVTNQIYVADQSSDDVTVIDGATNNTTSGISVGTTPVAIAVNPATNKIYVVDQDSNDVAVIDGSTNNSILVPVGATPVALAINPTTDQIYVANQDDNDVTVIDGVTNSTTTIMADITPVAIAVNPVTNIVYVANQGSNDVTVIDGASTTTYTVLVGSGPSAIDVNPVTNMIYVTNQNSNNVTVIYGAVNDTAKITVGSSPSAVVVNPVTNLVYVINQNGNDLSVIDGTTNSAGYIDVGTSPSAVAFNSATQQVFVANSLDNNVTVITPAATVANPLTAQVQGVTDSQTADGTAIFATTNPSPAFQVSASSGFSPFAPAPTALYYQLDTLQQDWQMATATAPGTYSLALSNIATGAHMLYVYAAYGNEASTEDSVSGSNSPELGALTAYPFGILATQGTPSTGYPVFTPAPGVYGSTQTVTLSDATPGAVIYYTLDGTVPTSASPVYSGPLTISQDLIIKAIATAPGYTASDVANGNYTIGYPPANPPIFTPPPGPYDAPPTVTLSDTTPGAKIYYTTDGSLPSLNSTLYTGPITVTLPETIRATAFAPKFSESAIVRAEYKLPLVDPPSFSLRSGNYGGPQPLELSDPNPNAVIYYSINGAAYLQYTEPLTITPYTWIYAYATADGFSRSRLVWAWYDLLPTAAPQISPTSGIYTAPQVVTITDSTPDATIYYTTDSSWPYSYSMTKYAGPFTVTLPTAVHAFATAKGYSSSYWVSADYEPRRAPQPSIWLPVSRGVGPQSVSLRDTDPNAVIYYTTDNTVPSAASTRYTGPFQINPPTLVQAIAIDPDLYPSFVSQAMYQLKTKEKALFTPRPGTYAADSVSVRMSLSEPPATGGYIYYTTDGSRPVIGYPVIGGRLNPSAIRFDPKISASILVTTHLHLRAVAVVNGIVSGPIANAVYRIVPKTKVPVFVPGAGQYCGLTQVTLRKAANTTVYYTVDGSAPTEGSPVYSDLSPIPVGDGVTINAFAVSPNHLPSPVATATFSNSCTVTLTPRVDPITYGQTASIGVALTMNAPPPGNSPYGSMVITLDNSETAYKTLRMRAGQTLYVSVPHLAAGTHTVKAAFTSGSFTTEGQGQFTVQPKTLTLTGKTYHRYYGSANSAFYGTVSGVVSGDQITATWSTDATPTSPVTSTGYSIVPTLQDPNNRLGNYTQKVTPGLLTILPNSVRVLPYGCTQNYGAPTFACSIASFGTATQKLLSDDGITISYVSSGTALTAVGLHPGMITPVVNGDPDKKANYIFNLYPGTLNVTKTPFTVQGPTATKALGDPDPDLSCIISPDYVKNVFALDGISYTCSYSNPDSTTGVFTITPQLHISNPKLYKLHFINNGISDGAITITP